MKKIKIAIIELNDHPVFLDSLIEIFSSNNNFEVSIYISNNFKNKFGYSIDKLININIQKDNQTIFEYIRENKKSINSNEVIFFPTPNLEILSKFNFKPITILNIHNLNTWLNRSSADFTEIKKIVSPKIRQFNLSDNIYEYNLINYNIKLLKSIKIYLIEKFYYKRKRNNILNKIDSINLLHPNMNNLVNSNLKSKIINLPFRFPENDNFDLKLNSNQNWLTIGILGNVEQYRKDYTGFLRYLKRCDVKYKLKIILLGTFRKNSVFKTIILNLIKDIEKPNIRFEIFKQDDFIDQELFNKKMNQVDIIVAPIQKLQYNRSFYKENYGISKATGSDFDAFYYKKPIIMPKFYNPIYYLSSIYDFYSNYEELFNLLKHYSIKQNLINKYNRLENDIYNNLDEIKKIYFEQLNTII